MKVVDADADSLESFFNVTMSSIVDPTAEFRKSYDSQLAAKINENLYIYDIVFLIEPMYKSAAAGSVLAAAEYATSSSSFDSVSTTAYNQFFSRLLRFVSR